jgi:hypothetical protein
MMFCNLPCARQCGTQCGIALVCLKLTQFVHVKQIYKIRFAFLLCFGDNGFLDTMVMLLGADKSDVPRQKKNHRMFF